MFKTTFRAGLLPYDIPLNLVHFLRKDCNYISWKSASDVLNYLNKMLARSKSYPGYSVSYCVMKKNTEYVLTYLLLEIHCQVGEPMLQTVWMEHLQ